MELEEHHACGHRHRLNEECPGPDSPAGRLRRALLRSVEPARALERLVAIRELRALLDEQEQMAVIAARMARCTWAEMGAAWGTSRQGAFNRWGPQVKRYEAAGLLRPVEQLPASAAPVVGAPAPDDGRSWCRWCGHRIVFDAGRWQHNSMEGAAGDHIDVECLGSEPWPAW